MLAHREPNEEIANPLSRVGRVASMTFQNGRLVVTAPPYVLRQVLGHGPTVRPSDDGLPRVAVHDESRPTAGTALATPSGVAAVRLRQFVPSSAASRISSRRDDPARRVVGLVASADNRRL